MLRGEKVYLTTLDPANAETIRAWINDPEIHRWMLAGHVPVSVEQEKAWYDAAEELWRTGEAYRFEIFDAADKTLLGNCGLEHVSQIHGHAEVGLFVAPPGRWGHGFGGDVLRTLLRYAFDTLRLHVVRIAVFEGNVRALELYKRVGFRESGRDREACYIEGRHLDLIRLDILESEWRAMQDA